MCCFASLRISSINTNPALRVEYGRSLPDLRIGFFAVLGPLGTRLLLTTFAGAESDESVLFFLAFLALRFCLFVAEFLSLARLLTGSSSSTCPSVDILCAFMYSASISGASALNTASDIQVASASGQFFQRIRNRFCLSCLSCESCVITE